MKEVGLINRNLAKVITEQGNQELLIELRNPISLKVVL